jgi:hypothetical protein
MAKQVRQVTPPAIRIWLVGITATAFAAAANVGWLLLCVNTFKWEILVPAGFQSTNYVEATQLRIAVATAIAGLLATVIAVVLGKVLIGPRLWFLVSGLAVGLSSTYGAVTLPDMSLTVKFSLSVMHILATFLIVLPIAEALKIRASDLHRADLKYHEHIDSKNTNDAGIITTTAASSVSANEVSQNLNQTQVIPLDSPSPDASTSTDSGSTSSD